MRRAESRLRCGCALLALLSGCSFIGARGPRPGADPRQPLECTRSTAPAVVDLVLGAAAVAGMVAVARDPCRPDPDEEWGGIGADICQDMKPIGMVTLGLPAVLYLSSSAHGFSVSARCREATSLQERCLSGDGRACLELSPGNVPAPVARR